MEGGRDSVACDKMQHMYHCIASGPCHRCFKGLEAAWQKVITFLRMGKGESRRHPREGPSRPRKFWMLQMKIDFDNARPPKKNALGFEDTSRSNALMSVLPHFFPEGKIDTCFWRHLDWLELILVRCVTHQLIYKGDMKNACMVYLVMEHPDKQTNNRITGLSRIISVVMRSIQVPRFVVCV